MLLQLLNVLVLGGFYLQKNATGAARVYSINKLNKADQKKRKTTQLF